MKTASEIKTELDNANKALNKVVRKYGHAFAARSEEYKKARQLWRDWSKADIAERTAKNNA